MSTDRSYFRFLPAVVAAIGFLQLAGNANAGCFDWFGGQSSAPAPVQYTANYPVAVSYSVAYPQQTSYPQVTGYAPATGTSPVAVPTPPANPGVANSGVVQAQRPAYGAPVYVTPGYATVQTFQNPSVYTGLPVNQATPGSVSVQRLPITPPAVTSNRLPLTNPNQVPIASTLRGNTSGIPITSTPLPNSVYTSNYAASGVAPVTYNTPPATTAVPITSAPQQSSGWGLTRFFNSCLGRKTEYTTSYYQAPITYYRPLTTVNPVTGTTVTMQQPCSSTVQLLQRTPSNALTMQNAVPTTTYPGACPAPAACTPGTFVPPSNIGQVSGQSAPSGFGVAPIPSTIPNGGFPSGSPGPIAPPNSSPLTGGSPNDPMNNAVDAADVVPMPKPELQSGRPNLEAENTGGSEAGTPNPGSGEAAASPYPSNDASSGGNSEEGQNGPSEPEGPAIQLDPPVTRWQQRPNPAARFESKQQYTTSTPPSLSAPATANSTPLQGSASLQSASPNAPAAGNEEFSTLRPIGVPGNSDSTPLSPNLRQPDERPALQAPPLPAPSTPSAEPSGLFRNSESTASVRQPSSTRVTVPIREATARNSVRQVAAWEEVRRVETPPKPVVKRDRGGWLPAR